MDAREPLGLRERKKIRTRDAIRREAFRLFERNGYPNTTVEQIAAAADISSRTFFRYFPAKEHVLIDDDLIPPIIDAFIAAPPEMAPLQAYKHAVRTAFAALTPEQQDNAVRGQRLMYTVPEARAILYSDYVRLIGLIADALKTRFPALDEEYAAALASCERRTFVVQHEAFGYLAHRYDLEQVGISGIDPEGEPSPARLREVGAVVRDKGVTTIFFETLASPKVAQTLAADLGVQTAVLDPIEGVTDDSSDYFSIASDNLEALRVALSCS